MTSCELGEEFAPTGRSSLLVHAVLSPTIFPQAGHQLLLERTWDGEKYVWQVGPKYSSGEPIVTGGGWAETRAVVDVTLPSGEVRRALEPNAHRENTCCAGVYLLPIAPAELVAGATYRLRIQTRDGEIITASTTMPAKPVPLTEHDFDYDRSRDTTVLAWPAVAHAAAYEIVVSNPYRNLTMFTESTSVRLTGGLRNIDAEGFPHAFLPGFEQRVSVYAVDSNYYDYYRSRNGTTGRGLVNRIAGGFGVFGAIAPVVHRVIRVGAPFTDPAEGEYRFLGTPEEFQTTLISRLTLYVESPATKAGGASALSGTFSARPRVLAPFYFDTSGAFLGRRWGDSIEVAFLSQQRITDTMEVFKARVAGDTVVGRYRQRVGTWRFLKASSSLTTLTSPMSRDPRAS